MKITCCSKAAYPAICHARRRTQPILTGEELKQNAACTMSHIPKARCLQDQVVICQPRCSPTCDPSYKDTRMANHTAGTVPAESWFCKLFEHVFNCSITSCQALHPVSCEDETRKQRALELIFALQPVVAEHFLLRYKKSDHFYCSTSDSIPSNANMVAFWTMACFEGRAS